jgi:hypothetical protein
MSQHWFNANGSRLMAEILRDFCVVSITLEEQFNRYDNAGNVSYAVLRKMLGDQMDRGILWRLKDTAHHLLRDVHGSPVAARLLDWAIGYIFHKTFKLMENTHQHNTTRPAYSRSRGIAIPRNWTPWPEISCKWPLKPKWIWAYRWQNPPPARPCPALFPPQLRGPEREF